MTFVIAVIPVWNATCVANRQEFYPTFKCLKKINKGEELPIMKNLFGLTRVALTAILLLAGSLVAMAVCLAEARLRRRHGKPGREQCDHIRFAMRCGVECLPPFLNKHRQRER